MEHLRENGADGISDVEGKVARVAMSELGNERISMLLATDLSRANGMSDMAGKAAREAVEPSGSEARYNAAGCRLEKIGFGMERTG